MITACGGFPEKVKEPAQRRALKLKMINYNLWFGLGQGFLKKQELESPVRRQMRLQYQMALLKDEKPDVLFLQEVNPVESLSQEIAYHLGMSHVFQRTNCGISFFGLSVPVNLDMGISIFVRPPLKVDKILGLKLSGPIGFCEALASFQYDEFRYALFALASHPKYGSFLLVNTHLHHGPEWSPKLREQISDWEKDGVLTSDQRTELESDIENSNQRRRQELETLLTQLTELHGYYGNLPVILAGDFNATVESSVYARVMEYNLHDSTENYSPTPYTWDPPKNKDNHQYTAEFGVSVPVFEKREVEEFFQRYDARQRRIDYIFVNDDIEILDHYLFGSSANDDGIIGSDHFGVQISLKAKN